MCRGRGILGAVAGIGWLVVLAGCNDGGGGSGSDNTTTNDTSSQATEQYNLTGSWRRPGLPSTYRLKQSGSSLQGLYYEPYDADVSGAIAGSVDGNDVSMDVAVHFVSHPEDDFVAHKDGKIHNKDHMTLVVTGGPRYVGQVQEWYRR